MTLVNINLIKPKNLKIDDKYSVKLYKLFKSFERKPYYKPENIKVYFTCCEMGWSSEFIPFEENIHKTKGILRKIIINPYGSPKSGYILTSVLRKNNPEHFSFMMHDTSKFIDVTEWFFKNYVKLGRCFFDKYHYGFDNKYEDRYHIINANHRKCKYCGEHFKREIKKRVEIKRDVVWNSQ
jgi:hypothetical protein